MIDYLDLMGIKFGEIDSAQILDNEYRSKFVAKVIEWVLKNNPRLKKPSNEEVEQMQEEVSRELEEKYPKSGVKLVKK